MIATAKTQNNAKAASRKDTTPSEALAAAACITLLLIVMVVGSYYQTKEDERRAAYASEKEIKASSECAKAELRFYAERGSALTVGDLESIEAKCKKRADEIARDRQIEIISQAQAQAAEASPVQRK